MKKFAALVSYLLYFIGWYHMISFYAERNWDLNWFTALLLALVVTAITIISFAFMSHIFVKTFLEKEEKEITTPTAKEDIIPVERKPFRPINIK